MIVFFDTSALIYLVEGKLPFALEARKVLGTMARKHPDLAVAVNRLIWLECRVGPMKANDHVTLAAYDEFFAHPDLHWIELSQDVVELAAVIRARHGVRTPDALHAASCLQLDPEHVFLTGDKSFLRIHGLNVRVLG